MPKTKRLKLKPSARDKRRYFLAQNTTNKKIEESILKYIGVLGFAKSAYLQVKTKDHKGFIVGSCLRDSLEDVRAALGLAKVNITKVSSTIKGLGK
jgi:RNase P/RNase MRP subunit POP5